ncbi:MAG: hypothetical protein QNJ77_04490 [Acidimicrobiia bacterium]|nr:hypothetical protein [Acidimicrobiia bacterium]
MFVEQVTTPTLPADVVGAMLDADPSRAGSMIGLLHRGGFDVSGDLGHITRLMRRPSVLDVVCLFAIARDEDPDLFARTLERAELVAPDRLRELHAASTFAIGRAATMRWITAHVDRVKESDQWLAVIPGLGGVTKSVPLAEEALVGLMKARARLPRELTAFVQLNPWFSRRFAIRYRRRMKGKRIRLAERAATARGWSHARTVLMADLPRDWQSLLKRGEGRPLDRWSHRLLTDYTEVIERFYSSQGVPQVLAPLYVIAFAGRRPRNVTQAVISGWHTLPFEVAFKANTLLGLANEPYPLQDRDQQDANGLAVAAEALGGDRAAWRDFAVRAFAENHGIAAASAALLRS